MQKTFATNPSSPAVSWMYFWRLAVSPQTNFPTRAERNVTPIAVLKSKANHSPKCWNSLPYCDFIPRINGAKDIIMQFHNDACGMVLRKCNHPKRILMQVFRDYCCLLLGTEVKQLTDDWDCWCEAAKHLTALCSLGTTAHCTAVPVWAKSCTGSTPFIDFLFISVLLYHMHWGNLFHCWCLMHKMNKRIRFLQCGGHFSSGSSTWVGRSNCGRWFTQLVLPPRETP